MVSAAAPELPAAPADDPPATAAPPSIAAAPSPVDPRLAEAFTALELDFFQRAEELYGASFDKWEDLEPDPKREN